MPLSDSDVKGSIKRLRLELFYHTFTECGDFRQILILQIKKSCQKAASDSIHRSFFITSGSAADTDLFG